MSDFDFISDAALRSNLNQANELILELVLLTESKDYLERSALISSLRKTVIIHTASIVEALLLWKLKKLYHSGIAVIDNEWEYKDIHKIQELIDNEEEIIWCRRKLVKKKTDGMEFRYIIRLCSKHAILRSKKLTEDVDKLRKLRNNLHISGLSDLDREYQVEDLEFCFSVLGKVKKLVEE